MLGLPMIDWTVNVGNIIQIVVIIGGGMWMFMSLRADVRVVRHDMNNLKERQSALNEAFTQLGTILRQVAVQDERIAQWGARVERMEKTIDELRHGQGFINPMRS